MIWRVFKKKADDKVEIIMVNRDTRMIWVHRRPRSQRALIEALLQFWKDKEVPWSITEVLRFERPQHVFYEVVWTLGEEDD